MKRAPNRLIHATSPYLLQHAYNPVDWHVWGEEAFQKAKSQDKPIFLSIGYSTCHWCHVMERESFEDEEIANILNTYFVPIKVDREELPDVDHIYITAVQMMGISAGWPLNVFLTPDLKPITGGTYFPPIRKWGMPSFKEVLWKIIDLWKNHRSQVNEVAENITHALQNRDVDIQNIKVSFSHFESIIDYFYLYFDAEKGGFLVNGKNKFPPSLNLLFLNQLYRKTPNQKILEMIQTTIVKMRNGGIYDQIGGGISRYATDHDWLVPHFEKMLYDNALFAWICLEAYRTFQKEVFLEIAKDVLEYLLRDMKHPEGGFYSAEDADSEGEEGKFYLWTKEEIESILKSYQYSPEEIQQVCDYWGIRPKGNFEGKTILSVVGKEISKELLNKTRQILLLERNKRIRPHRDEKILTSWNALMLTVLSQMLITTQNPVYNQALQQTLKFIFSHLTITSDFDHDAQTGYFYRSYSNHQKKTAPYVGTLSDHALMGSALVDVYKATGQREYLYYANRILKYILKYHFDPSGKLFETRDDEKYLIVRSSDFYDGVIPSGFSATMRLLVQLWNFGFESELYESVINKLILNYYPTAAQNPFAYSFFLMNVLKFYFLSQQLVVVYHEKQNKLTEIWELIGNSISSETVLGYVDESKEQTQKIPLLENHTRLNDLTTFYLCENFVCNLPTNDWDSIRASIR
ncbi:MAG: thioredoxin domain-containing protein [Leptospiraceae bacterium]|nr:thioredoxin domain-containing protein [Leptospiraceae bacterium]MDW7975041.1 thioredoxin domain-containing protein [Leptospiraceae bacterium]